MLLSLVAIASIVGLGSAIDTKRAGQGCYYTRELQKIVCAGGEPLSNVNSPVYTLDVPYNAATPLTNATWETIAVEGINDIPKTSSGLIIAPINSKGDQFFYQGGLTCNQCPPSRGYVFDLNQKSWRKVNNEPVRYGTQGFFINNTIFHFGGVNEGVEFGNVTKPGVVDRLESVDIKNFATTRFDSPLNGYPPGLYYHGTVPDPEGHLFTIIGGLMHDGNDMAQPKKLRDMQSFAYARPSDSMYLMANLREGSAMPEQRWGHTLVYNSEGQIVLFGGCDLNNKAINSNIWIFDHATTSWIQKPTKGDAPSPRCMHSVVVIDDYMVVLFGKNADNSYVNDPVVALNMQTMEWSKELRLGAVPSTSSSASIDYGATNGAEALGAGATGGSSGLGGGAIAGIVIGAVAGVALIGAAGWFMYRRKQPRQTHTYDGYVSEPLNDRHPATQHGPGHDTGYTSEPYRGHTSSDGTVMSETLVSGGKGGPISMAPVEMLRKPDGI